ncbi:MAG TPA: class I SAM-dependent methyltransferase [Candidatus Elarobacter sp.]
MSDFERNRRAWDASSDAYQERHGAQLARRPDAWGIWSLPEAELQILGDVEGKDVLEYGCGAAQWAIALSLRGARVVGLDNSARQLAYAQAAVAAAGVDVRLVHAPAEHTPFADASFDVVFCDHGAMSFASPDLTIPEVARILRPGGILAFNVEHPLHAATWDDAADGPSRALHHAYFDLDRIDDPADGSVNFARPISGYVTLLEANGFVLERLLEPRPEPEAETTYFGFAESTWARDFPAELLLRARLRHPERLYRTKFPRNFGR